MPTSSHTQTRSTKIKVEKDNPISRSLLEAEERLQRKIAVREISFNFFEGESSGNRRC